MAKRMMKLSEFDEHLDRLDIQPILNQRVRQVRWLYNNHNKCTMVYDEKLVRLIVHRLSSEINHLREQLKPTNNANR